MQVLPKNVKVEADTATFEADTLKLLQTLKECASPEDSKYFNYVSTKAHESYLVEPNVPFAHNQEVDIIRKQYYFSYPTPSYIIKD